MRHPMQSAPGARTLIDGHWRDYFSGTGYLGLQGHPDLIQAGVEALQQYGLTTATSRGGYGEHPVFDAVESAAARFFDEPCALHYVSAFLGSEVLLEGLKDFERVFVDAQSHFSVWSGARAAGRSVHAFAHCDAAALADALKQNLKPGERPLLLTDGVFPISGEIAPVDAYVDALFHYEGALLCLDDAHAGGILGANGRGTAEHFGVADGRVGIHTAYTLSKALGGHGGIIAGSRQYVDRLWREASGPLGGSSPAPLPAAAASAWALDYAAAHPELRSKLRENVARARAGFRALGWELEDSPVPIICLRARPGLDLAHIQAALFERDICVAHVTRYSSTPAGGALRVAVFASHTDEQVDRLLEEVGWLA